MRVQGVGVLYLISIAENNHPFSLCKLIQNFNTSHVYLNMAEHNNQGYDVLMKLIVVGGAGTGKS